VNEAEVIQQLNVVGAESVGAGPDDFDRAIKSETERVLLKWLKQPASNSIDDFSGLALASSANATRPLRRHTAA
jgi:hypothetical protein